MIGCDGYQKLLTPLIDGELSERDLGRIETHLARCEACAAERDELLAVKGALSETFTDMLASAPAAPESIARRPAGRVRRLPRWLPALTGVAAAVLVIVFFFVLPTTTVEASPAVLLQRAASRYVENTDAELWIRLESPLLEGVIRAFGDESDLPEDEVIRVLVGAPNRVLCQTTTDPEGPWDPEKGLVGFDGEKVWEWDPKAKVVRFPARDDEELRFELDGTELGFTGENIDFLKFLSWSFVDELTGEKKDFEIKEITGPSARRAGRRILELRHALDKLDEEDDGPNLAWARARVTIDTENDRIDRFELDFVVIGMSLVRVTAEVAEVNAGVDAKIFEHSTHLPADAKVVDEREAKEKDD